MALLRNFLCCCNLRTGGVIIGWVGGVLSFLTFLSTAIALSELPTPKSYLRSFNNDFLQTNDYDTYIPAKIGLKFSIGISFITLVMNSLLLYGIYKGKKLLLIPWLISVGFKIVGYAVTILVFTGLLMAAVNVGWGFLLFFFGSLVTGIIAYIWICILSLYQVLREEEQRGPISDDCIQVINSSVPYRNFEV